MLAPVRVRGEQQDAARGTEHEGHADHRLLHFGPDLLGPREQERARERRDEGRDLHGKPLRGEAQAVGEQHAAARDLRDREIDEYDSAREHLHAERHVRCGHQQARGERGAAGSRRRAR